MGIAAREDAAKEDVMNVESILKSKGRTVATIAPAATIAAAAGALRKHGIGALVVSTDGAAFQSLGEPFTARPGRWIGAKVGLFAVRSGRAAEYGNADFDWFRVEP